jgi:CRISPR-associated endonuclease/helicase Cas3
VNIPRFYAYWGKAQPDGRGASWHRLAFHSLDVAAVAGVLLDRDPALVGRIAAACGATPDSVRRFLPFVVGLHDLGKFSEPFQWKVPEVMRVLRPGSRPGASSPRRHDVLGFDLWRDKLAEKEVGRSVRLEVGGVRLSGRDATDLLQPWISASTGHHGAPPTPGGLAPGLFPRDISPIEAFIEAMAETLRPGALEFPNAQPEDLWLETGLKASSWLVAGLTVLSDWLGSAQEHFPYADDGRSLAEYWVHARRQATQAVEGSGVLPARVGVADSIAHLFAHVAVATPLQAWAEQVEIGEGPQLFVLEETTGAGKTEAALMVAHRLMAAGRASGVYVALPTMATANAMHARIEAMYLRLFSAGETPSFVLAHGARRLTGLLANEQRERPYEDGAQSASEARIQWVAAANKRALLASVGVGTIDQALLAAMPVKHSTLRLLGLNRSVLVVDEVHACDAYMGRLLETLLELHASLGGSAILLSATLPIEMRRSLTKAFRRGLGAAPAALTSDAFPLATRIDVRSQDESPVATRLGMSRRVPVRWIETEDDAVQRLMQAAEAGRCGVWIRNSVNDAIEAYDTLVGRLGANRVTLFHARFPMGERLEIERRVLALFGRDSTPDHRAGRVLVATQVVEQSLDLDFDSMVTDLAPIDLLIQRAGRLHRHIGRERPAPELVVLAPPWTDAPEEGWLRSALRRTASVYKDEDATLWLSMRTLRDAGRLEVPANARGLIEAVYGEGAENAVPEGLAGKLVRAEGKESADKSVARLNAVRVREGFLATDFAWADDQRLPTRLGDASHDVLLLAWAPGPDGGTLRPLWAAEIAAYELSRVRLRIDQFAIGDDGPWSDGLKALLKETPGLGEACPCLVLRQGDAGLVGTGKDAKGRTIVVRYRSGRGVEVGRGG